MRITNVTTTALSLPVPTRYSSEGAGTKREWGRLGRVSPRRPKRALEYLIVKVETDEGITGVGEAATDISFFGEPLEEVRSAVAIHLGPRIIGRDPFDREGILDQLDFRGNSCARSGIDLAIHDLLGRALGIPVCSLLGGRTKDRVPVSVEIAGGAPGDMATLCVECLDKGIRAFKAKIGGYPQQDAERLKAIREAVGPDVSLRADANQGYSPKEAIRLCRLAERYRVDLELLEQPVPHWDLAGMAEVRRNVDTLIEADESAYTIHDVMNVIRAEAADVINIKIAKAGGLHNARKIAALAEAAGLQCVLGTAYGLAPKIAAKLHLASSMIRMMDAVEFTEIIIHESLAAPPYDTLFTPPLEGGCMVVPEGPGLGVELDEERMESYLVDEAR
jgi:L-alanine-DL-glutamate epimerase-like enolase superfamily enzyme